MYPTSKCVIGSQDVPYIYEDRVSKAQFHSALTKMYSMSKEDRIEMGLKGREHVLKNYNFVNFQKSWVEIMDNILENGSWDDRAGYSGIRFSEVA